MVTWSLILETVIKWLIPVLCVALVGFLTVKVVNPVKKGSELERQEEWDERMRNSKIPQEYCDKTYAQLRAESDQQDKAILNELRELKISIDENNTQAKQYHQKVDKQMGLIQQGVLDAHLQNLIATCQIYIKRGYVSSVELAAYQDRLLLYKQLGGNGHMDVWDQKIRALPTEPVNSSSYIPHLKQSPLPPQTNL